MSDNGREKIAFIGTHGVGKTTLCYDLTAALKRQGINADMVKEVARLSPLPVNRRTSLDAQTWIVMTQVAEESRSASQHHVVVCDRSVLDNYAYMALCIFTQDLDEPIYCRVAHGEGNFVARDNATLTDLQAGGFIALRYVGPDGNSAGYPWNPNGSQLDVAGLCNRQGTILGLMPHPEDHIIPQQHPQFLNGEKRFSGLPLFRNGVRYAAGL